jgi:hypothetical protein
MNIRKVLASVLVLFSSSHSFAGDAPILKMCNSPEEIMTAEQFQDAIAELIKMRVIEYRTDAQRLMLKDPSALEQLKRSNRVDQMCALATVVCW